MSGEGKQMTTPQQPPRTGDPTRSEPSPSEPVDPIDERPIDLTDVPGPESGSAPEPPGDAAGDQSLDHGELIVDGSLPPVGGTDG
jgi:hypothetical protein